MRGISKLIRVPVRVKWRATDAFQTSNGLGPELSRPNPPILGLRSLDVLEVSLEGRAILMLGLQFGL